MNPNLPPAHPASTPAPTPQPPRPGAVDGPAPRRRRMAYALAGTAVVAAALGALAVRAAAPSTTPSTAAAAPADRAATGAQAVPAADPAPRPGARPALTVSVVQPQRQTWPLTVAATGGLFAWQEASVGAEAPGLRLAEVRVNVGDVVRRGQVLAVFDAALVQAELAQQQAAVAEAEALLAEATANADRARDLGPKGVISAQQANQLLTAERTAAARVQAQRAALKVQSLRVAQARVLAPDDGVISARSATVGAVVPGGQELFRLIRQGRLEWRAEVAATDLAALKPGQAVKVVPNGVNGVNGANGANGAGAPPIAGRLRMVAPTVDTATRSGLVYVDLPAAAAAGAGARAGMFARGEFEVGRAEALTLPAAAVLLRDGHSQVFTVGADQRVSQRKVTVGRRLGERVEVTGGLDAAARVVAEGAGFLGDGDTVRVVDAPAAAPAAAPGAVAVRR